MPDRLLQLEENVRNAVARRNYAEVQQAVAAYCARAAKEWGALPPGDQRARRIFERLEALLEWVRLMLSASRASAAGELQRVRLTNRYVSPRSDSAGRLRLDI